MKFECRATLVVLLCLLSIGCHNQTSTTSSNGEQDKKLQVAVVNYPLAYFAQRIGGDKVTVKFPVPADVDPAYWKPTAEDVSQYQSADLILLNGASYASWVQSASLPESKVVQTSAAFTEQLIPTVSEVHSHGPEGEHSHEGTAFTTWLDTDLALLQARAVRDALAQSRPESKEQFEANYTNLETELREVDESLKKALESLADEPILYSHPVYQYFGRYYQLNGEAVHWEPSETPSEQQWQELDQIRRHHPAKIMIWEDEPLAETVTRLKDQGVEAVVFEPLGHKPAQGDYLSARRAGIERLEKKLLKQARSEAATE